MPSLRLVQYLPQRSVPSNMKETGANINIVNNPRIIIIIIIITIEIVNL